MKKLLFITLIVAFTASFSVDVAFAQYTPLEPLPCIPGQGLNCTEPCVKDGYFTCLDFKTYVQYMFNLVIALAAAGAVFMIIYGGLVYMTAEAIPHKQDGLQKVKNALFGLLLVLTSFLILRTIDPRLVAIPTTLVTQLKVPATKSFSDYLLFMDYHQASLDRDYQRFFADKAAYDSEKAVLNSALSRAKQEVTASRERFDQIEDEISRLMRDDLSTAEIDDVCRTTTNASIRDLCRQRESEKQSSAKSVEVVDFVTAIAAMRSAIQHCRQDSRSSCFTNIGEKAKIPTILAAYEPKVGTLSRQLAQYATYASSWFTIIEKIIIIEELRRAGTSALAQTLRPYAREWNIVVLPLSSSMKTAADGFISYFNQNPNVIPAAELTFIQTESARLLERVTTMTKDLERLTK